jgi:ParB family transcriptional regulator, chromosome partitioning protein
MVKRPVLAKMRGVDSLLSIDVTATNENQLSSLMALDEIIDRPLDTRQLNLAHMESLAESIAVLGLIQPIAVDSQGRLLAGGHRRAAIVYLQETNPVAYAEHFSMGIPVRRYDFNAFDNPSLALAIEATENEKRRDYTATEVRDLADRLKDAGYHHTPGRARAGQKALLPSLAVIVGKSERQIKRYLATELTESPEKLNGTDVPFSQKYLKQAVSALLQYQKTEHTSPKERKLLKELPEIIESLERAIDKKSNL